MLPQPDALRMVLDVYRFVQTWVKPVPGDDKVNRHSILTDPIVAPNIPGTPPPAHTTESWALLLLYGLLIGVPLFMVVLYVLFQRRKLSPGCNRCVARLCFYPSVPFTVLCRECCTRRCCAGQCSRCCPCGCCCCVGPYMDLVDEPRNVWLGGVPIEGCRMGHVSTLHERGVRAVVNAMDEYPDGPTDTYARLQWEQLSLRVVDHCEPPLSQLVEAIDFIRKHTSRGHGVYIHCKSGHGRGAAIAFCWLLAAQRLTPEQAQQALSKIRHVRKELYKQPNILAFYREHASVAAP